MKTHVWDKKKSQVRLFYIKNCYLSFKKLHFRKGFFTKLLTL